MADSSAPITRAVKTLQRYLPQGLSPTIYSIETKLTSGKNGTTMRHIRVLCSTAWDNVDGRIKSGPSHRIEDISLLVATACDLPRSLTGAIMLKGNAVEDVAFWLTKQLGYKIAATRL